MASGRIQGNGRPGGCCKNPAQSDHRRAHCPCLPVLRHPRHRQDLHSQNHGPGGELPALVLADTVGRLVKGVLADDICFEEESHYSGLMEFPQYTKPAEWHGKCVPEVLLSGHHKNINEWKRINSLIETKKRRPDLFEKLSLTDKEKQLMEKFENRK